MILPHNLYTIHVCSTLAEIGVFELVEDGSLQPALPRDSLLQLLQSSPSFFALAGYTLTIIDGMYIVKGAPPTIIVIKKIIYNHRGKQC